jgi:hypothetical protein
MIAASAAKKVSRLIGSPHGRNAQPRGQYRGKAELLMHQIFAVAA